MNSTDVSFLTQTQSVSHFYVMDFARGLAAILVMVYHVLPTFFPDWHLLRSSFLAVDLFFLMSGYVVARAYEHKILDGRMSLGKFARVRFIRLYPLYLISCLLGAFYLVVKILLGHEDASSFSAILSALPSAALILPCTTCQGMLGGMFPLSPAAWSLALEFWFNILYATRVFRLSNGILAAVCLFSFVCMAFFGFEHGHLDIGMRLETALGGVSRFWFSFSLGVLMFRKGWVAKRMPPVFFLSFPLFFLFPALPNDAVILQLIWVAVVFPLFVYLFSMCQVGPVATLVFDQFGRMSYGLYILHTPVFLISMGAVKVFWPRDWMLYPDVTLAAVMGMIFLTTALLTYLFDDPLRRRLRFRPTAKPSAASS